MKKKLLGKELEQDGLDVKVNNIEDALLFDVSNIKVVGRGKKRYYDIVLAFDIETSLIPNMHEAFMYIFQVAIGHNVYVGREWNQFVVFINHLNSIAEDDIRFVIYVHNLSYEFHFIRFLFDFEEDNVFLTDSRRVLRAIYKNVEFRCSYLHCNMSLDEFLKKMDTTHRKLSGEEFDYSILRFSDTKLSDMEMQYCVNDVLGLVEAIEKEMALDKDTLATIPLTSTGYVRRDVKTSMKKCSRTYLDGLMPDLELYKLSRDAFRGGNCHASRYYAGRILKDVKSYDRSSSYPDVICNCRFPSRFRNIHNISIKSLEKKIYYREKALLFRCIIEDIKLKDRYCGFPYISVDKCQTIVNCINDNGRVLKADLVELALTDIDYKIIADLYEWNHITVYSAYETSYKPLPIQLIRIVQEYYKKKTELKGVEGQEVYYEKLKNKLNSIYGMMAQNPFKEDHKYINGEFKKIKLELTEELVSNTNKKLFLPYTWGVWTTAWARYRLHEGMKLVGDDFVYADTDSVKYIGEHDWDEYNSKRMEDSINSKSFAKDPNNIKHYMGVYESEGCYSKFITWGSKKYVYEKKGKTIVVVSGVNKKIAPKELMKLGGIENFKPGLCFRDAGGMKATYNDHQSVELLYEGKKIFLTSNCCLEPSTYTLGITSIYDKLIKGLEDFL